MGAYGDFKFVEILFALECTLNVQAVEKAHNFIFNRIGTEKMLKKEYRYH